jgi:phosphoribosyl 1,2-cyclic phosphodiesterase
MSIGGFRSLLSRWGTVKSDAGLPLNDDAMLPCGDVIVRFWGVRGSVPTPGRGTVRYGGNTSCVELRADGQIIALDAGSGIRQLGLLLLKEFGDDPVDVSILLTHHHWDHIQGFPFFLPAYAPRHRIKIVGYANERFGLEETMKGQMANPYFPISLTHMPAKLTFQEVTEAEFSIGGVRVESFETNHPGVCKGYKLHTSAGTICYIPDHEFIPGESSFEDGRLSERNMMAQFIRDAELVIMDAQYTEKEYLTRVGWGHSSVNEVVRCACDANVKRLVLFHHDPSHDDEFLDAMLQSARILATYSTLRIDSAKEGDCIRLVRQCKLPV